MEEQDMKYEDVVKKLWIEIDDLKERIGEYILQDDVVIFDEVFWILLLLLL